MHRFKIFAIWNMVSTKKNQKSEIYIKSESSVSATQMFKGARYGYNAVSSGTICRGFPLKFHIETTISTGATLNFSDDEKFSKSRKFLIRSRHDGSGVKALFCP
jgi:hypothetical protein